MSELKRMIRTLWADDDAAAMVEYILIISLIALVAVVGVRAFGTAVGDKSDGVAVKVSDALK